LKRLHSLEAPLLSHRDAANYPGHELDHLIRLGLLRVISEPEVMPKPGGRSGHRVAVRRTANGFEAVACDGDPFFPPFALTPEQVRHYEISLHRLVEQIRKDNDLAGGGMTFAEVMQMVGQKRIEGFGTFDVYLSLPNYDPAAFSVRCLALAQPRSAKCLVVLIPQPVTLPPSVDETLEGRNIFLIPLLPSAEQGHLKIDWDEAIVRRGDARQPDGAYSGYVILGGRRYDVELTKREMQFLNAAFRTNPLPIEKVWHRAKGAIWKGKYVDDRTNRNALSRFLSDLNTKLAAIQPAFPIFFSLQRGEMAFVRTSEPVA